MYSISYWYHTLPLWRIEFNCDATLRYIFYITCVRVRVDPQPNSISPSQIREIAYCSSTHNLFHLIFRVSLTPSEPIHQIGSRWSIVSSPFISCIMLLGPLYRNRSTLMLRLWHCAKYFGKLHEMLNVLPSTSFLSVKWCTRILRNVHVLVIYSDNCINYHSPGTTNSTK